MRRQMGRLASQTQRAVAFVSEDLGALRQQGALARGAPATAATAAACSANPATRCIATAARLLHPAPTFSAAAAAAVLLDGARLAALQLPFPARTLSTTAAAEAGPGLPAGLPGEAAAGVPKFSSAIEAAEFVRECMPTLQPAELGAVVQQLVQLHMGQVAQRGGRMETAAALGEIVSAVLADDSHLRSNGSAVPWLMWGAAKLRLRASEVDREALLAAAERCVGNARAKALASTMWALGWLHLSPSPEYWQVMGNRLFGDENLVSHLRVPDLIPALSGISIMNDMPQALADMLMQDLQRKTSHLRAREVGGIANFLPSMPQTQHREELAEKVFTQAARLAPHMDLVGVSSLLWGAAKLGSRPKDDTIRALIESSRGQLGSNRGHAVPGLLWALGKMGYRAGDGIVSEEFVRECIDSQMATIDRRVQPQKLTKFLNACGMLRVTPTEEQLEICFNSIVEQDFFEMEDHGLRSLLRAFQGFRYWKGVDAMKEKLGIQRERPQRHRRQPRRQQQEAGVVGEEEEQAAQPAA